MSNIHVEARQVVVPGQVLATGMDYLPGDNTYRREEEIIAKRLGTAGTDGRVIKVTPLNGPYFPKVGDKIIGKVFDILMSGWRINTGSVYPAMLPVRDASNKFVKSENLRKLLDIDDYCVVKITKVSSQNMVDVGMRDPELHKLEGGRVIKINCNKVPRVIGKMGSMIGLIKKHTNADITVGQNGLVWIKAESPNDELRAETAIKIVDEHAHQSGLTEKVEAYLNGVQ